MKLSSASASRASSAAPSLNALPTVTVEDPLQEPKESSDAEPTPKAKANVKAKPKAKASEGPASKRPRNA